jgi:hypothetical protein
MRWLSSSLHLCIRLRGASVTHKSRDTILPPPPCVSRVQDKTSALRSAKVCLRFALCFLELRNRDTTTNFPRGCSHASVSLTTNGPAMLCWISVLFVSSRSDFGHSAVCCRGCDCMRLESLSHIVACGSRSSLVLRRMTSRS